MSNALGQDIASYQGDINYDTFKSNSQFVIIKATEGIGFKDPKFSRNQSEARRVGMGLGYYHFARTDLNNSPEREAQWFLDVIGSLRDGEVLALDWECANQKQADVDWCKKWLDYVKAKTGVAPLIYLNQSQHRFNWKVVVDAGYGLWIAAYTGSPTNNNFNKGIWPFAAMQQWTNGQIVPGVPAKVDGDVFFGDLETFKKYGYKTPVNPTPTPQPSPITAQTKIPANLLNSPDYPVNEDMEVQRINSELASQAREIKSLKAQVDEGHGNADKIAKAKAKAQEIVNL